MRGETVYTFAALGLSTLVRLAIEIALLVATLTVVRRNKPSAVVSLATSFALGIVSTVASLTVYPLLSLMAGLDSGVHRFVVLNSATTVALSLLHAVSGVLLVIGIVKLAEAPAG
jgi:hypothetical protein